MSNKKTFANLSEEEKFLEPIERTIKVVKAIGDRGIHDPSKDKIRERVQCECGRRVWDWILVDCRHLPISQNWACDGCWSEWQRRKIIIDGGSEITPPSNTGRDEKVRRRREWDYRWEQAHGASSTLLDAISIRNDQARG